MTDSIPAVVGWIFILIFAATATIVLLDLAGMRKIKDRAQRKWLFRAVIASVVVAVGGLGTALFKNMDPNRPPAPAPVVAAPTAVMSDAKVTDPAAKPPVPKTDDAPSTPDRPRGAEGSPAESADEAVPAAVRDWAEAALGPRPLPEAAVRATYPTCVADLRERAEDDILQGDAAACRRELISFHSRQILSVYARKTPYERKLQGQEEALRLRHSEADSIPRYKYVESEMARLTGEGWDRFVELDHRIALDQTSCLRRKCRA
jgi:hypothetical protein